MDHTGGRGVLGLHLLIGCPWRCRKRCVAAGQLTAGSQSRTRHLPVNLSPRPPLPYRLLTQTLGFGRRLVQIARILEDHYKIEIVDEKLDGVASVGDAVRLIQSISEETSAA